MLPADHNYFRPPTRPRLRNLVDVLMVGGTWHPNGDGITAAFTAALDPARYRVSMVPYPAQYGGPLTYADSTAAGRAALLRAIEAAPGKVILAGYSQGAAVAGDVAELADSDLASAKVLACALIADPLRPAGHCVGRDPGGYGVAGQRNVQNSTTFWAAAEGDPITALPAGNPLRTVADLGTYFSLSSPAAALRWGRELIDAAARGRMQRWWSSTHRREWAGALAYARGYLVDGRHTGDYIRHGHVQRLAEAVDSWVLEL